GVGAERRARWSRGDVYLAPCGRRRYRRRSARDCPRARTRPRPRDLSGPGERTQRDTRSARVPRLCAGARAEMIVRWGLRELPVVLAELRIRQPLLVASPRWDGTKL